VAQIFVAIQARNRMVEHNVLADLERQPAGFC
jgi:hypothetical protein